MSAIGYIRVSTEEQAGSGLSLASQRERIEAYCVARGWELSATCEDAMTGTTLDRPGLRAALAALHPGDVLVVAKLDRLVRRVRLLGELLDHLRGLGAGLASVAECLDTSSASGRLLANLLASVAEWERDTIAERTSAAMRQMIQQGRAHCLPRYGWRIEGGRYVPDPAQQAAIALIRRLRGAGMPWDHVAAALTAAGHARYGGGRVWSADAARRTVHGD